MRPWKDTDGKWYSSWSTDGCNGTNQWGATPAANLKKTPCKPGGQLELLVSDALHGPKANWKQLPPMFTTVSRRLTSELSSHLQRLRDNMIFTAYFSDRSPTDRRTSRSPAWRRPPERFRGSL